jgi:tetratricopeptide (TPR) repeat protein
MRRIESIGLAIMLATVPLAGCGRDAADREYFTALEGDEKGLSREEQIAHISRAIALAPRRAWYYELRAGYETDHRDFAAALADLDRAIAMIDRPYAHFSRGLVLCQSGRYAASIADFDTAIARQPTNDQFYRGRSLARAALGDAVGALNDAERLIALAPQRAESYHARGVAFAMLGHDREALADFDRAAAIRPELVYVADARVRLLRRMGDEIVTAAAMRQAAELRERESGCAACLDPFRY